MATKSTELILMARAARRYYVDDMSKTDIADELGVSRFRVARLISMAKRAGLVKIQIDPPGGIDAELSVALQQKFGLAHAVVIDMAADHPEALRTRLGEVAGEVLQHVVGADDVLGMAWARSLCGIGTSIRGIAACPVVQITGALSGPDGTDVIELVRRVAAAGGGKPRVFYAPLVAPDAASARMVRRQPDVAAALELAAEVTVAVVGIGAWQPGLSTIYDVVDPALRTRTGALGTIGEISGALIDEHGRAVTGPLSRRIIGVTADQLESIRTVVSVAYGEEKAPAVGAAIRGGLINGLITHSDLAQALLDDAEDGDVASAAAPRTGRTADATAH